jgi:Kef-type K+ transport system membrane component KefB
MSPELIVLVLNAVLIVLAYQYVYPRWVGNSMPKLIINDVIATCISLMVTGSLYGGSGQEFSLLLVTVNWFWFSLVSYSLMEMPMAMRYMRRHNMLQ